MKSFEFPALRPGQTIDSRNIYRRNSPGLFERRSHPARTFVFYEDVKPLMDKGLIKGGSLENAVVVRGDAVAEQGTVASDEFVRHKILDIVGDLSLFGRAFVAMSSP